MPGAVMRSRSKESQAIKIQKRSQKRDADTGMIINNALRNKNQKNV